MTTVSKCSRATLPTLVISVLLSTAAICQVPCEDAQCFDGNLCWGGPVEGTTHSQVARSRRADFSGPCRFFTADATVACNPDAEDPAAGEVFYYLVRGDTWGQASSGQNRIVVSDHWEDIDRQVATTALGNRVGIACHNCYHDIEPDEGSLPFDPNIPLDPNSPTDLGRTRKFIHEALRDGADAISLDIYYNGASCDMDSRVPNIEVHHGGNEGPCLGHVLELSDFRWGDQLLQIESKEVPTEAELTALLCLFLPENAPGQEGVCPVGGMRFDSYARPGRPLILQTLWTHRNFLWDVHAKLKDENLPFHVLRDRVRLYQLFLEDDAASYADIDQQAFWPDGAGVDGFGFDFNEGSLFSKIAYVKSLGLGVTIFGNSKYCLGDIYVASMREEVDSMSVDYPMGLARQVAEEDNNLLYLNVWDQFEPWRSLPDPNSVLESGAMDVTYWDWDATAPKTLPVNSGDAPTLRYWSRDLGEDMFGGVLDFDRSLGQRLAFPDTVGPNGRLDNWSCGGYLLAAVANFDLDTSIGYDVVSKAESSGFFLDRADGFPGRTRFGVHINNTYNIAHGAPLPTTGSYLLIGSYDGHGPVRFWARGGSDFTEDSGGPEHGGATQNDYEMMIGADPGVSGPGSFFDGKLQRVSLLAWGHHPVPPDLVKRYAGQTAKACTQSPHIDVELAINANDPSSPTKEEDSDSPPGTSVPLNEPVKLTYMVSNPGDTPIDMSGVTLGTQVHQTPGDPTNPPPPSSVDVDGYNTGDTNRDLLLDPGEIWQYEIFYENAPPDLPAGARTVEAIVNHSTEAELSDCDMSHYHVP